MESAQIEHGGRALRSLAIRRSGLAGKVVATALPAGFWTLVIKLVMALLPLIFPLGYPVEGSTDPDVVKALKDTE